MSQLIEPIFAELGISMGFFPQANTMEKIEMSEVVKIMENAGLSYCGDKVLYSGVYGNQMKSAIFMGPLYFQRSILQTRDKINARGGEHRVDGVPVPGGGYTAKERQVVSGRANGGGVKIGEMERDSLLSHGITSFINERDTTRGDKFYIYVSPVTGEMMIGNPDDKIFFDNSVDGPISYHLKEGTGQGRKHIIGPNMFHKKQHKFVKLQIPYAMKLNIHDFMGMGMSVRLKPEVRKLVYDKYMAGEQFENLLMEFDDIIEQQNAKAEEYLKQSLVEQLAKEKAEQKMGEGDMNDEALDDINSQVEQLRQEKLDSLNAFNQLEMDISGI
jgi:DNA-directed RNA polymerase beta subunit